MKITDIIVKEMSFRRRKVFKIAFTASAYARGVYVKVLTDAGICGMGEACPMPFVTGETIGGVIAAIEHMKGALLGSDPEDPAAIHANVPFQPNPKNSACAGAYSTPYKKPCSAHTAMYITAAHFFGRCCGSSMVMPHSTVQMYR